MKPIKVVIAKTGVQGPKGDKGDKGDAGSLAIGVEVGIRFEKSFTVDDLNSSGLLITSHTLGIIPTSASIITPQGDEIIADLDTATTTMAVIDMQDVQPLIGTYLLVLRN